MASNEDSFDDFVQRYAAGREVMEPGFVDAVKLAHFNRLKRAVAVMTFVERGAAGDETDLDPVECQRILDVAEARGI